MIRVDRNQQQISRTAYSYDDLTVCDDQLTLVAEVETDSLDDFLLSN
jgi:hypothetical protein